jgi:iduronate 2-sulfatase
VELLDLYPTLASMCGLEAQQRLQGKDVSKMLDDPAHSVREAAFCVAPSRKGFLLREENWSYIQYGEKAQNGIELFDAKKDPKQYDNLAKKKEYLPVVKAFQKKMENKLATIRENDLKKKK